jgi:hypothetical protein
MDTFLDLLVGSKTRTSIVALNPISEQYENIFSFSDLAIRVTGLFSLQIHIFDPEKYDGLMQCQCGSNPSNKSHHGVSNQSVPFVGSRAFYESETDV